MLIGIRINRCDCDNCAPIIIPNLLAMKTSNINH